MRRCALCQQLISDDDNVAATAAGAAHAYCQYDGDDPPPKSHLRGQSVMTLAALYADADPYKP
jgi:hypothetical protein